MKKIKLIILTATILWSCGSKKEPEPCQIGTFQSSEYNCGGIKVTSTIVLRNDGTGTITDPACINTPELQVNFTYKEIEKDYYSIKPESIYLGGKLTTDVTTIKKLYQTTYQLIGYIGGYETMAVFMCENNNLLINSEGFAAHIPNPLWKRK